MDQYLDSFIVVDRVTYETNYLKNPNIIIIDKQEYGEKLIVQFRQVDESDLAKNISIPIASAITALSIIQMSEYIMKYSEQICSIDTDGIKLTCKLDDSMVGKELGKMKHEGSYKYGVFIAPKVYGLITKFGEMIIKIKGSKEGVSFWRLLNLLYNENIQIFQDK
jgi:hypothetical protein